MCDSSFLGMTKQRLKINMSKYFERLNLLQKPYNYITFSALQITNIT